MKSVIISAKSFDIALEEAMEKLGCSYGEFDHEIIENGGLFKKGKFKFTLKEEFVKEKVGAKSDVEKNEMAAVEEKKVVLDSKKSLKEDHSKGVEEVNLSSEKSALIEKKKDVGFGKEVVVNVGELSPKLEACLRFVEGLVSGLGNDLRVTTTATDRAYTININGEDVGRLIGKGGEALDALQVLVSSVAISNANGESKRVYVNIENYKERREETLKSIASKKAEYVRSSGKSARLESMSPRDRAIIHNEISKMEGVRSYSIGEGNARRLVIAPARNGEVKQEAE
ncbi:MAG: KH domain-containing protein [Firmicutes bacterium]|nr:KH domain-containing protein [Bacillota bacterium]